LFGTHRTTSYFNLLNIFSVGELYEFALLPEHLTSCDPSIYPTTVTDTGALSVSSGLRTGRSPKDKRVVLDETTKDVFNSTELKVYRKFGGAK
jgi:ATP-dependent phosphoenolpyruvate carboxykinase